MLAGGADIAADRYGAPPHPRAGAPRPDRDATELAVLDRALSPGHPGARRVPRRAAAERGAGRQPGAAPAGRRRARRAQSRSPGVYGTVTRRARPGRPGRRAARPTVEAQCHHHQAIDRLADGLVVTGRAADGTIEAVELADRDFVLGVQWHPEQDDLRLFSALVAAARAR